MSRPSVGDVLAALSAAFPLEWAEDWDAVGLRVGNAGREVVRALVTLDAGQRELARAQAQGCDVLVTHHPPFIDPLDDVTTGTSAGSLVLAAANAGISIISMHTNLDRSPAGAEALPGALGMRIVQPLEEAHSGRSPRVAMGRLCQVDETSLGQVALDAGAALGVDPRVWGPADARVARIAVGNGSVGSLIPMALAAGADVLLGGEVRYHDALDAVASGLAIIEVGHDASEWPMVSVLAGVVRDVLGEDGVVEDPAGVGWWIAKGE